MKFNLFRKRKKEKQEEDPVQLTSESQYMIDDPLFVGFPDVETQYEMYNFMMRYTMPGESIIDFGAGRGDLYGWLTTQGRGADKYTGIEMNPVMISAGKLKYPGIDLRLSNWKDAVFIGKHDWGINAFSITANYEPGIELTPIERLAETIENMMRFVNYGVCIGLLLIEEEGYINYSVKDVIEFCEANNFSYILDKSFNDSIINLVILKK